MSKPDDRPNWVVDCPPRTVPSGVPYIPVVYRAPFKDSLGSTIFSEACKRFSFNCAFDFTVCRATARAANGSTSGAYAASGVNKGIMEWRTLDTGNATKASARMALLKGLAIQLPFVNASVTEIFTHCCRSISPLFAPVPAQERLTRLEFTLKLNFPQRIKDGHHAFYRASRTPRVRVHTAH